MTAGRSAGVHAQELRRHARRGVWRKALSAVGVTAHTRAADARAASFRAGEVGEQRTAALLQPLTGHGWRVWHDLAIPGAHSANADHLVLSAGGRLFLVDSKLWNARNGNTVHGAQGRLWHGQEPRDQCLRSLEFEARRIADAVGVQVWRLIVVHTAPVAQGGFDVQGVGVVPAQRLLPVLGELGGPRDARTADAVAGRVDAVLRGYPAGPGG